MENFEYYQSLAEKIFFFGINSGEVSSLAIYRSDKTFKDLGQAVSQGRLEGIGGIASRLYEVLEIDTKAFNKKYGEPDQW